MSRLVRVAVLMSGLGIASCEALPIVHVRVREFVDEAPVSFRELEPGEVEPADRPGSPVSGAIVVVCPDDGTDVEPCVATDDQLARIKDSAWSDGSEWPTVMRTNAGGRAKYSELRIALLLFAPPGPIHRRFEVWADGCGKRSTVVEINHGEYELLIPLTRVR